MIDFLLGLSVRLSVLRFLYIAVYFGPVCVTLLSIVWRSPDDDAGTMSWAFWAMRICLCDTGRLSAAIGVVQTVQNCVCFSVSIKILREITLSVFITFTLENSNEEVSNTNHFGCVSDGLAPTRGCAFFTSFWSPNYTMQINALSIQRKCTSKGTTCR